MSVLVLVVNDVKCRKYTTKNISTKDLCDYFLKLVGFSTFGNVGIANKRMWVASQPASFHLLYIGRTRASLPPYTPIPWGYASPPDDCMPTHFHIFQGNGSPECARRGQKRQQKQSNCLACVNQFSMAFATLSTDSVYNERKRPGKAGIEKQKTARKKYPMILCNVSKDKSPSIQYYFAKYPCFVFCLPCHIRRGKPAEQIAQAVSWCKGTKSSRTANALPYTILPDMDIRKAGKVQKSRRGCPENGTASCWYHYYKLTAISCSDGTSRAGWSENAQCGYPDVQAST